MKKSLKGMAVAVTMAVAPISSHALVIGLYSDNDAAETAAANVATGLGHTAQQLADVSAASLAGLNVLWILNSSNSDYGLLGGNVGAVAAFVRGGGVLSFHDRYVAAAASVLPGAAGVTFTSNLSSEIDVLNNGVLVTNGPAGLVNDSTLDGGNFSNHGWASLATLPAGAIAILSNGIAEQVVDFSYGMGAGAVYYSTIPLDFYLDGSGNNPPRDAMQNIYAVNELAYQASLSGAAQVPEPGTMALLGLGFLALGLRRFKAAA